ncbi:sigma-70 family RNA polymerase sigma factor [Gemmata sp. JC673]|uniref:Sigma-70 family RNA polymerase sigma factor n=1 Tax=Gemmata algarum TaxID=2975278 RepID=A0ABU5FAM3_9BACT|nr:sigma-70 family RNA polymerase sigma factor [Gemmata algarum]MDY3562889.1 sigma-70 family RNA polymerase sigma factor [Gemmata algarum]
MSRRLLFRLLTSAPPAADPVTDTDLLRRFAATGDTAALELVVRRHAGAVWAACRRVLPGEADAEDAFQATFLALIRNAKSIRAPSAGGWLHRVAVNAALKLRERSSRVPTAEPQYLDTLPTAAGPSDAGLAAAVHEELERLPERERLPLVLCDLEGLSHADAAQALGWPVGTVSGRLSRARAKLRARFERRGLAPSAALLPALAAPPHLIPRALSLTTGAIPPVIVSLTEGALAMLKTSTWTWTTVAVVCAGLVGTGAAIALTQPGAKPVPSPTAAPPAPAKDKPPEAKWIGDAPPSAFPDLVVPERPLDDPNFHEKYNAAFEKRCPRLTGRIVVKAEATDGTLQKLLKARLHQGVREYQLWQDAVRQGGPNPSDTTRDCELLVDIHAVVMELWAGQPKEFVPWLEELLIASKDFERNARLRVEAGALRPRELTMVLRYRLRLEAELWKAKNAK